MTIQRRVMTRKKKKIRKKRNKNKIVLTTEENDACWAWARRVTKEQKRNSHLANKKVYCEKCGRHYCLGFDSVDVYCDSCHYMENKNKPLKEGMFFTGCTKEITGGRLCQKCSYV